MIDVQVHLRGQRSQACAFPSLPRSGDLVSIDDNLWRVAAVVFSGAPDVYVIRAAENVTDEFATWCEPPKPMCET